MKESKSTNLKKYFQFFNFCCRFHFGDEAWCVTQNRKYHKKSAVAGGCPITFTFTGNFLVQGHLEIECFSQLRYYGLNRPLLSSLSGIEIRSEIQYF